MTIMTYRQALNETLRSEMLRDPNVFLMGEEIGVFEGSYKITAGLLKEFGEKRVRDTPIAEEGFAGAAIGAAMLGLRPVIEMMTINFSMLALDQIINHAAKIYSMFGGQASVPLVIRTPGGGGQQLGATHSQNIELCYAFIPGMKVVARPTRPTPRRCCWRRSETTTRCCSSRTSRYTTPRARFPTATPRLRSAGPPSPGRART